jgi:hypothetical protein
MPLDTRDYYRDKYRRTYHRPTFRLWRTIIGCIASFLLIISVATKQQDFMTMFAGSAFGAPGFLFSLFGAIVSYWKRRFGAIFMFIGFLFGLGLIPFGGLAALALLMLLFCIISSYWHVLPD